MEDRLTPSGLPVDAVADGGFSQPSLASGSYSYCPNGYSPWTFSLYNGGSNVGAGVSANGSGFTSGNPSSPAAGNQVAFLQQTGWCEQEIEFTPGAYTLSFFAAQRGNDQSSAQEIEVEVPGAQFFFTPTSTNYGIYETPAFSISTTEYAWIVFQGVNPHGGDNTAFVTNVTLDSAENTISDSSLVANGWLPACGYSYNTAGTPWSFNGNAGISDNGTAFTGGNPTAPSQQVAFIQENGSMTQTVYSTGGYFDLSLLAAQRANGQTSYQEIEVTVNSNVVAVGDFIPGGAGYQSFETADFPLNAGMNTIAIIGIDPNGGDNTVFLTGVQLNGVPTVIAKVSPASPSTQVDLSWTPAVGAESYQINQWSWSSGSGGSWQQISSVASTDTSITVGDLEPNTTYYFYVGAIDSEVTTWATTYATVTTASSLLTPTVVVNDEGATYSGNAFAAVATIAGSDGNPDSTLEGVGLTLDYESLDANGNVIADLGSTAPSDVGNYLVTASFAGSADYASATSTASFTIAQATPTVSVSGGTFTANGSAQAAMGSVTGVGGVSLGTPTFTYYAGNSATGTPLSGPPVNPGTYTVVATYAGSQDYAAAQSAPATITITGNNKTTPTFSGLSSPKIIVGATTTTVSGSIVAGKTIPSGTVTVQVNGVRAKATIGTKGTFSASLPTAALGVGTYSITYSYGGSNTFNAVTATGTLTVSYEVKILSNVSTSYKAGGSVPFQIELLNAAGKDVSASSVGVSALSFAMASNPNGIQTIVSNGAFTFGSGSYKYTLATPRNLPNGTYVLDFQVQGDPIIHTVNFVIRTPFSRVGRIAVPGEVPGTAACREAAHPP
jgi:hypothetical protein